MSRTLLVLVATLLVLVPSAPGSAVNLSTLTLVTVDGVPAFEAAVSGFLREEPNARVIRFKADLGNARSSLEEESARSPSRVVVLGSQAALAVNRWLAGCPTIFGFILTPSRLPKPADDSICYTLTLDPEVRIEALSRLFRPPVRMTMLAGPDGTLEAEALATAGARRNVSIRIISMRQASDISSALRSVDKDAQALLLTTETLFLKDELIETILLTSLERRIPVIGFSEKLVRMGGLASLEINYADHAAEMARTARAMTATPGRRSGEPIQFPHSFRWVVNPQTARTLGITVPGDILSTASKVGAASR